MKDKDIKREREREREKENFRTGACAPREGGSREEGKVSTHWGIPSQLGPRGSCGTSESHAKVGAQRKIQRELHFSALMQLTSQP